MKIVITASPPISFAKTMIPEHLYRFPTRINQLVMLPF
jgi:hypothetical protein